jgi:hypothetical protein
MPLYGWKVSVFLPKTRTQIYVPLPPQTLGPNADMTISGPYLSLTSFGNVGAIGPSGSAVPGGFELIAPDGTVTDRAGQVDAPAGAIDGTGVPDQHGQALAAQRAYVRRTSGRALVDTGNNAADFVLTSFARANAIRFRSKAPSHAAVGGKYKVKATGRSISPVTFSIGRRSSKGACTISGAEVEFTAPGTCVVTAHQAADLLYLAARAVSQSIRVGPGRASGSAWRPTGRPPPRSAAATPALRSRSAPAPSGGVPCCLRPFCRRAPSTSSRSARSPSRS